MLPLCAIAGLIAPEVKGASRWLSIGGFSMQPSEILKPAIVIVWAWMLGEHIRRDNFPGRQVSIGLYLLAAAALLTQPDIGQTALLGIVFAPMLLLAGRWFSLGAGRIGGDHCRRGGDLQFLSACARPR